MNPMDFEEFLLALKEDALFSVIKQCFEKKQPIGQALHRKAMDLFRLYLIIGGMPQAVNEYCLSKNFEKVDSVKRQILELYRNDIQKHAKGSELKAQSIFDEIPAQLSKHEKKFKISSIKKEARMRDYDDAFMWLSDSRIVNICYNSDEPNIGLKLNMTRTTLKCYMADTGLLISHAFDEKGLVTEEIYKKLLFGKLEMNEGMIFENIVSQMLVATGRKLYFYSKTGNENASSRMEIDFLITKNKTTSKHNIQPIEVKSSKRYTFSSLEKFKKKYSEYIDICYILHTADLKVDKDLIFLPVYMTGLL